MDTASDTFEKREHDGLFYESSHLTSVKFLTFKYKWTIHNFKFLATELTKLESPTFPNEIIAMDTGFDGCLRINHRRIKVYASYKQNNVPAKCKLSILDRLDEEMETAEFKMRLNFVPQEFDAPPSISAKTLDCTDDVLTILCEIAIPTTIRNISTKFVIPTCRLREDLCDLFEKQKLCDIILCSGKQEIQAHKALLAARSPVFNAMFENDMVEKSQNRVDIIDVDPEILKEMLHFIYTGNVPNLKKTAINLLIAAEKYALCRLKVMCVEEICKTISIENAPEVLQLGVMYNAIQLTMEARVCLQSHIKKVSEQKIESNLKKKEAVSSNNLFYELFVILSFILFFLVLYHWPYINSICDFPMVLVDLYRRLYNN